MDFNYFADQYKLYFEKRKEATSDMMKFYFRGRCDSIMIVALDYFINTFSIRDDPNMYTAQFIDYVREMESTLCLSNK